MKQYITNSVLEVVRNYDIDSVHWTITLYPYPVMGRIPDDAAFRTYGNVRQQSGIGAGGFTVNQLVKDLSHEIKSAKTCCQPGISPLGYGATSHPTRTVQIQER
ncbi:family 10 glycosylhydrolase [Paenibacillus larvae]|nr:family 10 glycosylhydrolase [Paenibacillus larvae]MDT2260141.1 family 10 glycosylhydrolase [Paenibacillus larvae]